MCIRGASPAFGNARPQYRSTRIRPGSHGAENAGGKAEPFAARAHRTKLGPSFAPSNSVRQQPTDPLVRNSHVPPAVTMRESIFVTLVPQWENYARPGLRARPAVDAAGPAAMRTLPSPEMVAHAERFAARKTGFQRIGTAISEFRWMPREAQARQPLAATIPLRKVCQSAGVRVSKTIVRRPL